MRECVLSRDFSKKEFDSIYNKVIIGNHFFEKPEYYQISRPRYRQTLKMISDLPLPNEARILEVGGGQIALLMNQLFHDNTILADIDETYSDAVTQYGLDFFSCDLVHDDSDFRDEFDLVVMLEVIEHLPIPPHIILEKMAKWIKPGGYLFLTTPNLYRIRNAVRLFMGMPMFDHFYYPQKGESLGHPFEYSSWHLKFQLERAGLSVQYIHYIQFQNKGFTFKTNLGRKLIRPFQCKPIWRDSLVACVQKLSS